MQVWAPFFQFISLLFQRIDLQVLETSRDSNLNACIGSFDVQKKGWGQQTEIIDDSGEKLMSQVTQQNC